MILGGVRGLAKNDLMPILIANFIFTILSDRDRHILSNAIFYNTKSIVHRIGWYIFCYFVELDSYILLLDFY